MNNQNTPKYEFQFIPVPRKLMYDAEYSDISSKAKALFILILNRFSLSAENIDRFSDGDGNPFIYLSIESITEKMGIGRCLAIKLVNELTERNLIVKKRRGLGKANSFTLGSEGIRLVKNSFLNISSDNSAVTKNSHAKSCKSNSNDNIKNDIIINDNHSSFYERQIDGIKEQIEYDCINADPEILCEIVMIMYDVMYGSSPTVRIGANIFPRSAVYARYRKLTAEHIESVIHNLENSTTKIINVNAYLTTALYNAPTTVASSASADFAYHFKNRKS